MTRMNGHKRAGLAETLDEVYENGQKFGSQAEEFKQLLNTLSGSDFVKAMANMRGNIIS